MIEIIPPGTRIDFLGKRWWCAAISGLLLLAGVAAIPVQGFRLGIDFAGGTEVQVRFAPGVEVDEGAVRSVVGLCGVPEASVVRYGESDSREFLIKFRSDGATELPPADCPVDEADRARLSEATAAAGGEGEVGEKGELVDRLEYALADSVGDLEVRRVEFVGPRVGADLQRAALKAISLACLLILVYTALRFSARFAPGAVIALVHDVAITAGIFVIFGLEFDLRVLAALLAILGYSLNDTIIIYDRIRENMELHTKYDLVDVLNRSVNQTLSRTVLTSGTTLMVVIALFFLGGEVIRPFALAMAIGIVVGTYSSIFIAAPTLLLLERRFGQEKAAGAREERREPRGERSARAGKRARR